MRTILRLATLLVPLALGGPADAAAQSVDAFVAHLEALAPALMAAAAVPGTAVALVEDGAVVWVGAWGVTDVRTDTPVGPTTVFNVGSISKTVTAWAVLRLADEGRIDLDAPVNRYLERWAVPGSEHDPAGVTVRRLLSHTAGLSLAAVDDHPLDGPLPGLVEALADPERGPRLVAEPGAGWSYSGGGFGVLQLLVEDVTGRPFAEYVRETVLLPLGMERSGFVPPGTFPGTRAVPHDTLGRPIGDRRYVLTAAAGLRTTPRDLARFVAAWMAGPGGAVPGRGVVSPEAVEQATNPAPGADQGYGLAYGLGYNLIPLARGGRTVGHAGSNPGWTAVATAIPDSADGLVVLTNGAGGVGVYKWILCDWVEWKSGAPYPVFCDEREDRPGGTLHARLGWVDSLAGAALARGDAPGLAIVATRGGRVVHRAGYGLADVERERPVRPGTPFYVASLAKPMTAVATAILVDRGRLSAGDPLGAHLPTAPDYAREVPLAALLTHTSGVPDYNRFIEWPRFRGLDDGAVLDTLARREGLDFAPGTRYAYSNSNYALLARVVEAVAGRSFGSFLADEVFRPGRLADAIVHDSTPPALPTRAIGYAPRDGGWRLSDYEALELPDGSRVTFSMATTGAGGVFASADDVARFADALFGGCWIGAGTRTRMLEPTAEVDGPDAAGSRTRVAWGWYVSTVNGREVVWHDGARGGFRSALVHVREPRLTVAVLANGAALDVRGIALEAASRLAGRSSDGRRDRQGSKASTSGGESASTPTSSPSRNRFQWLLATRR